VSTASGISMSSSKLDSRSLMEFPSRSVGTFFEIRKRRLILFLGNSNKHPSSHFTSSC
jgi:hypothetical protein